MNTQRLTDLQLKAALNGLAARQRAIASNVANVDTPGYRSLEVDFESALRHLAGTTSTPRLVTTDPAHLPGGAPSPADWSTPVTVRTRDGMSLRSDGNNVDIDLEMTRLAETASVYNALIQISALRLGVLRSAATEGRK